MKKKILTLLVLLAVATTGAWAQGSDPDPIELTSTGGKTWTLAATPAYDVELEVEYETLALSETTNNSAALTDWNGYEADVTLTRTLQTGGWNTFSVPFSMATPSGWTVMKLTSSDFADGTLTLNFTTAASIEAGKPYLVDVGAANVVNPTFNDVTIVNGTTTTETTYVNFVPVMEPTTLTGGDRSVLYLGGAKTLYYPSANVTVKGFRAYFQLKDGLTAGDPQNGARAFVLNLGNHETGIQTLAAPATITDGGTYDLSGRRVGSTTRKGVYIRNGQKVVVK